MPKTLQTLSGAVPKTVKKKAMKAPAPEPRFSIDVKFVDTVDTMILNLERRDTIGIAKTLIVETLGLEANRCVKLTYECGLLKMRFENMRDNGIVWGYGIRDGATVEAILRA